MQKYILKLKDFNELVMFQHSIFSLPFILIAMVVAADGWFGFKLFILSILAALSARNAAMGFNRWLDRDIDEKNPRTASRPSVDGRLDSSSVAIFTAINALVFILVTYMVNDTAFYLSIPVLAVLASYSYFKRFSSLAHIVLGVSLALAPLAGVIAVLEYTPAWAYMLSIGVLFWVAGFDLLYSLQDIEFDRKNALHSIPSEFGVKATMFISAIFHVNTVLFWTFFIIVANLGFFAYMALAFSFAMLFYEHILVRRDFTQIDKAFFTVNGYLGIVFLIFIILDKIFS